MSAPAWLPKPRYLDQLPVARIQDFSSPPTCVDLSSPAASCLKLNLSHRCPLAGIICTCMYHQRECFNLRTPLHPNPPPHPSPSHSVPSYRIPSHVPNARFCMHIVYLDLLSSRCSYGQILRHPLHRQHHATIAQRILVAAWSAMSRMWLHSNPA